MTSLTSARRWCMVADRLPVIFHPVIVMFADGRQTVGVWDGQRWSLPSGSMIDDPEMWEVDDG